MWEGREHMDGGRVPAHPVPSDPGKRLAKDTPPIERSNQENHTYICIIFAFILLLIYISPLAWAHPLRQFSW